jgi:hypothetical protein
VSCLHNYVYTQSCCSPCFVSPSLTVLCDVAITIPDISDTGFFL